MALPGAKNVHNNTLKEPMSDVGQGGLGQAEAARRLAERFHKVLSAEIPETSASHVPATH